VLRSDKDTESIIIETLVLFYSLSIAFSLSNVGSYIQIRASLAE